MVKSGSDIEATTDSNVALPTPMLNRYTPGRFRFEAESYSSLVTRVAKFVQCFSGSHEKNVPLPAVRMSASGYVSAIYRMIEASSTVGPPNAQRSTGRRVY